MTHEKPRKTARKSDVSEAPLVKKKLSWHLERMNKKHAVQGKKVINLYRKITNEDTENLVGDLLADLMHLCDREPRLGNFDEVLEGAYRHYKEETRAN